MDTQLKSRVDDPVAMLAPGKFIDSDHPDVIAFAQKHTTGISDPHEKAIALYLAVRDGWRYDPHNLDFRPEAAKASHMFTRQYGYCGEKACLLAAACRAVGIPARLRFANVRNHVGTAKLEEKLGTDVLVFHGYNEVYLDGQWLKATPAFNKELCDKLGVEVMEFDGKTDSIFQEYDREKGKFMEYLHDYGSFGDLPYAKFLTELMTHYPHLFEPYREIVEEFIQQAEAM